MAPPSARPRPLPPSYLLTNATLVSMDPALPEQLPGASLLVCEGVVAGVFATQTQVPTSAADLQTVDVGGRAIIPGLTDGHAHLDRETLGDDLPSLAGARSVQDVLDVVAEAVSQAQPGEWIVTAPLGTPPDFPDADDPFAGGRLPDRHTLDTVSPDNPVFIRPIWGYWNMRAKPISVANSAALAAAGITAGTVSPHEDLYIDRAPSGEPTGIFVDGSPQPLVEHTVMRVAPGFTRHQRAAAISRAFERYAAHGTTAFYEGHGVADEVLDAYLEAYGSPVAAPLRGTLPLSPHRPTTPDLAQALRGWDEAFASRAGGSAAVDGIYVEGGADIRAHALRSSNHPRTGWAGFSPGAVVPMADLQRVLTRCAREGVRVCAIGASTLDAMTAAHGECSVGDLHWVLGHQATLSPAQVATTSELGLVLTSITGHNLHRGVFTRHLVGTDQEDHIVPIRSLVQAGVPIVLGSDGRPVSLWDSVHHVVTREDERGVVVGPGQRLTRHEALRLVTVNGAVLTREEGTRGALKEGYAADLAVLDQNPLTCPAEELRHTRSLLTLVGGRVASSASPFAERAGQRPTA